MTQQKSAADINLIYTARTAAYTAVWNAGMGLQVLDAIPLAMKAARNAVGMMQLDLGEDLLRASAWDAIWTVADGDDWAETHFAIVRNVSSAACMEMAKFNALEYLGCPGMPYAIARACAWRAIATTRTYGMWVEAYKAALETMTCPI